MSKMNLVMLFGQREENYEGQYAPEPLECWSEFEVDENPKGFEEACECIQISSKDEFTAIKVINIEVDQDQIRKLLIGTPTLKGKVKKGPKGEAERPPLKFSVGDKILYYWVPKDGWKKGTVKEVPEYSKRSMYHIIDDDNPYTPVKNVCEDLIKHRKESGVVVFEWTEKASTDAERLEMARSWVEALREGMSHVSMTDEESDKFEVIDTAVNNNTHSEEDYDWLWSIYDREP